jgi:hypothetical protein
MLEINYTPFAILESEKLILPQISAHIKKLGGSYKFV